jgi:hypothetical protein
MARRIPALVPEISCQCQELNRRFLVIINAGLLVTLLEAALAGATPVSVALLLTFSAILFSNGCWHLWASYKSYSPGAISGPCSICRCRHLNTPVGWNLAAPRGGQRC